MAVQKIVATTTSAYQADVARVMSRERILELQRLVRRIPVSDHVVRYAVRLARASRPGAESAPFIRDWVSWGAGPRAAQFMVLGAKARAALLRHRIIPNFTAEADGISSLDIVAKILDATPASDGKRG